MSKGRPKIDKPKEFIIRIRVTSDELEHINNYWFVHRYKSKSDLIRSRLQDIINDNYIDPCIPLDETYEYESDGN